MLSTDSIKTTSRYSSKPYSAFFGLPKSSRSLDFFGLIQCFKIGKENQSIFYNFEMISNVSRGENLNLA
jgi:hypothetical protein